MTDKLNWTQIFEETNYPPIPNMDPLPYEGEEEEATVKITDEEIEQLKDANGVLRYEKVFEWCLPKFSDGKENTIGLFKWQAERMSNYLTHLRTKPMDNERKRFKPRFFT